MQEAALAALGALAQDNSVVALTLAKPNVDREPIGPPTLQTVLGLCKSRVTEVQLAACLWYVEFTLFATDSHPMPLVLLSSFDLVFQATTILCYLIKQLISQYCIF